MKNVRSDIAIAEDYSNDYLFRLCGGGDEFSRGQFHPRFMEAVTLACVQKNDKVLDVGGGRGEIAFLCSKLGANTTIIDYSPDAINIIKGKIKNDSTLKKNITVSLMDVQKLKFSNNTYDKIFFLEVLEHLTPKQVEKSILQMIRVLKPKGKLIISTGPNKLIIGFLLFIVKFIFPGIKWESRKYHINEQSYFSLSKLLNKQGVKFKIHTRDEGNWFYGQITKNKDVGLKVKTIVKIFNFIYDFCLFKWFRSLPIVNKVLCTGFIVEVWK